MKNRIKKLFTTVIIIFLLVFIRAPATHSEKPTIPIDTTEEQNSHASKTAAVWPRKNNPVHMLVVFSKFKGEAPEDSLAPDWTKRIFDNSPGSVSHYYDEIFLVR